MPRPDHEIHGYATRDEWLDAAADYLRSSGYVSARDAQDAYRLTDDEADEAHRRARGRE